MTEKLRNDETEVSSTPQVDPELAVVHSVPALREAVAVGGAVVLMGSAGLGASAAWAALGGPADPGSLWVTPPLGAAVAILLAAPRARRPSFAQFLGLHGWALLLGLLGSQAARSLSSEGQPAVGAFGLVLLAGTVAALQSVGSRALGVRHPPAHATALLVLLAASAPRGLPPAEFGALAAGLATCGALLCPWVVDES